MSASQTYRQRSEEPESVGVSSREIFSKRTDQSRLTVAEDRRREIGSMRTSQQPDDFLSSEVIMQYNEGELGNNKKYDVETNVFGGIDRKKCVLETRIKNPETGQSCGIAYRVTLIKVSFRPNESSIIITMCQGESPLGLRASLLLSLCLFAEK